MTTLVEFLHPLRTAPRAMQCAATLLYFAMYRDVAVVTTSQVKEALTQARLPGSRNVNVSQVLTSSGPWVDGVNDGGRMTWRLTETGSLAVREALGLPQERQESVLEVTTLKAAASKLADSLSREFVEEGIACLQIGALRAAVVFVWTGAIRSLHDRAAALDWKTVNAAVQKHEPKAKVLSKVDDFALIKDRTFLLAARELGLVDKGQWTLLQHALDLRNQCGHPSSYRPGPKKVSAFLEDMVGIVFAEIETHRS